MPARAILVLLVLLLARPGAADPVQEVVTLPGPGGIPLRAILLKPEAASAPPVVALHGCGGLGGPEAPPRLPAREADWAARLLALGHPVLFPDSFGSRGMREVCAAPEGEVTPENLRLRDARMAAAWVALQPWAVPGGAFLLGWSHGGSSALAAAAEPLPFGLLRGVVALYPGCARPGRPPPPWRPGAPVLMLLGGADDWTLPGPCRLAAQRAGDGAEVEVVEYPGAPHGFDGPGEGRRLLSGLGVTPDGSGRATVGTEASAREDARRRVAGFLTRHAAPLP